MAFAATFRHHPWVKAGENVLGHAAAIVVGLALMVLGLGLGVTMVMLPVGLVVGFAGLALFLSGLFARFAS